MKNLLDSAIDVAMVEGAGHVGTEHLLRALSSYPDAASFCESLGLTPLTAIARQTIPAGAAPLALAWTPDLFGLSERARGVAAGLGEREVRVEHVMAAILLDDPAPILAYMEQGPPRLEAAWAALRELAPSLTLVADSVGR